MKKIAFVINEFNSLYDFRKELVQSLIEKNYEIHIISPKSGRYDYFEKLGCNLHFVDLQRKGKSVFNDLKYRSQIKKNLKIIKPDIVLSYSMKPNLHTGKACRKYHIPHIATVTGLGMAFQINKIVSFAIKALLRNSLKKTKVVFCQNENDAEFLKKNNIAKNRIEIIYGSGVNLDQHKYVQYTSDRSFSFLYAGRIAKNKGICELLEAFDKFSRGNKNAELTLAGHIDNTDLETLLNDYCKKNLNIKYIGFSDKVDELIYKSSCVIVPSYSEGMSNILQESLACGTPILASNIPGCKEICIDDVTGFLFKIKDVSSLLEALRKFAKLTQEERIEMSANGRKHVEKYFNRKIITNSYETAITRYIN